MGVNSKQGPLQTVDRALRLLTCFDATHLEWGVSDLARYAGWDKSVTQRLLATLTHRGFLLSDPKTRRYRLGPTMFELGHLATDANPLVSLSRPILHDVVHHSGETALFTVPDRDEVQCLAAVEGTASVRYSTQVGGRVPGHAGAGSKVLFAWLPEPDQRDLFGRRTLARFTESTITDLEMLLRDFERIRTEQTSNSEGEIDPDVGAIAAPVYRREMIVGAISAVGPLSRIQREREHLIDVLTQSAADMTNQLTALLDQQTVPRTPSSV